MKNTAQRFLILSLIFCALSVEITAQTCTSVPSGLVAWYRAENNALDQQGANHGSLQNGAGFAAGQVGQSFNFDGVDDFVNIPDSPSFDFGTNEISAEAWIMPTADSSLQIRGIMDQYSSRDATFLFALGSADASNSRQGKFIVYGDETGFVYKGIITVARIQPNTFTHVAATYKQFTQEIKFYINGVETATTPEPGSVNITTIFNTTLPVHIGRVDTTKILFPFVGLIDEPSLYNRALTDAEILAIFNAGTAGKCLAPTAASVQVSGRVTTAAGRGIGKARVSLIGPSGETRTVITNWFGYYRFEDVGAGESYVFSIFHKQFEFEPLVLLINEERRDLNFTALSSK